MYWLQTPPWGRWALSFLLVAAALWMEFGPDSSVEHPFATNSIAVGESISPANTSLHRVPEGLLEPLDGLEVAVKTIAPGAPVLRSDLGEPGTALPRGWWVVSADVPPHASAGDKVRLVLLDTGLVVDGVVAAANPEDPFTTTNGALAVAPENASVVAVAAAGDRLAVLISTG